MGKVVPFPVVSNEITEDMRDAAKIPNPRYVVPEITITVEEDVGACWRCYCGSFEFYYYMDGVLECSKCYTTQIGWDERV